MHPKLVIMADGLRLENVGSTIFAVELSTLITSNSVKLYLRTRYESIPSLLELREG